MAKESFRRGSARGAGHSFEPLPAPSGTFLVKKGRDHDAVPLVGWPVVEQRETYAR